MDYKSLYEQQLKKNEELQKENEKQLAAVECLKFMDYIYMDGQWMPYDEDEDE
tara:strand:- start:1194 stop:1352 length:159 start_codon:yes stop_codon:yes gene_type:complete